MAENYPMPPGLYLMNCMDGMKRFPDKFFDLAVVDPPYGDGNSEIGGGVRFGGRFDRYKTVEPLRTAIRPVQTSRIYRGGVGGTGRTSITSDH